VSEAAGATHGQIFLVDGLSCGEPHIEDILPAVQRAHDEHHAGSFQYCIDPICTTVRDFKRIYW
jgi:hypothetical protein